ncbi:MAG: DUF111 family protein [Spirochaetales bacterium]|nr:DUF111 family protein [Spirochaetales bacterium]
MQEKKCLYLDPKFGMAGDMFSAALISAGVSEESMLWVLKLAAGYIGSEDIKIHRETRNKVPGIRLDMNLKNNEHSINAHTAKSFLEKILHKAEISSPYSEFALGAMDILTQAETEAHSGETGKQISLFINHHHHTPHLHEAQDIIIDIAGAAWGLKELNVDLDAIYCLSPVFLGGGNIRFSHGELSVPAPATKAVIKKYAIPEQMGPVEKELLTPTGASLLAAMVPEYIDRAVALEKLGLLQSVHGVGYGTLDFSKTLNAANGLFVYLVEKL